MPKAAEAVGAVAGIANVINARSNKRMMYLVFMMKSLQLM
jgi:hypothetical protein